MNNRHIRKVKEKNWIKFHLFSFIKDISSFEVNFKIYRTLKFGARMFRGLDFLCKKMILKEKRVQWSVTLEQHRKILKNIENVWTTPTNLEQHYIHKLIKSISPVVSPVVPPVRHHIFIENFMFDNYFLMEIFLMENV